MDAISLLKDDHKAMKKLMDDIDGTTERGIKTREELLAKMKTELTIHERIEEEIFYPAMREHSEAKDIVLEAYEEHHAVDTLLDELESVPVDDETWAAKFTVIKENIEHHIEEEEGEMFEKAEQAFDAEELTALGERMKAMKDELKRQSTAA